MSLLSRVRLRSAVTLFPLIAAVCAAQPGQPQFKVPIVESTGGRVTSFVPGSLQGTATVSNDILYVNAPTGSGTGSSVTVGELLNQQGFTNKGQNQITFTGTTNVAAALADFNSDNIIDYAFALTPATLGGTNFCLYYGTGAGLNGTAYNGGNSFPAAGTSGCTTLPIVGAKPPVLQYITEFPFKTTTAKQVAIEDSANSMLYVFNVSNAVATNGVLAGVTLTTAIALPPADGAGPIYTGDFNGDGNTDLIVNNQAGLAATVYLGNGNGTFQAGTRYAFGGHVHSMLLQDMNGDGHPDMVVEGDNGVIQIYLGNTDGTFSSTSAGGTPTGINGPNGFVGEGGHLAAIADVNHDGVLDILTTTPIGLSVLLGQSGTPYAYTLGAIFNIGPGRNSFALAPFLSGNGNLDLAVDSAEGVAIVEADTNGDGGFQTSLAYSTQSPALGSVVAQFRTIGNANKVLDVVVPVGVGIPESVLLEGDGAGHFTPVSYTNNYGQPNGVPANAWANVFAGDFFGLGSPSILSSFTGQPLPAPGSSTDSGIFIQVGNGNGTFQPPANPSFGQPANNNFFGESTVADFNGDGLADIANVDADYDDVLLGQSNGGIFTFGLNQPVTGNTNFNQVAAGFFKVNRTNKQDLIFQRGSALIPYLNSGGTGTNFIAQAALSGTPSPSQLVLGTLLLTDVDGDGNGDVVGVYLSPNTGTTTTPIAPSQLYIWYGNGDGTFQAPTTLTLSRNDYLGAVADLNSDGLPDIILSDGSVVSILYNQGTRTFQSDFGTGCNPCDEEHILAGQGINSLSLADVNGDGKPDLIVANGGVTISNPLALGGATGQPLTLATNPDVNTGGITVLLNAITTSPVTATVVANPEPSTYQTQFTLTATITSAAGVALPTGTVQFYIDGNPIGSPVTVQPGATNSVAAYAIPANNGYAVGTHTLTAVYSGDNNNSGITANGTHKIVNIVPSPVTATVAATPEPSTYQSTFTLTAVITPAANVAAPTGTVQFAIDGAAVGAPVAVAAGTTTSTATYTVPANNNYAVGIHTLTAVYSGDTNNATGTANGSHTITKATTSPVTGTVFATPEPSAYQSSFTLTATVIPAKGVAVPTGTVSFSIDGVAVGGANALAVGAASSTASYVVPANNNYTVGTHTLTAVYNGDAYNSPQTFTGTHTISSSTTSLIATTTTLYLCTGPSATCPSTGAVTAPAPPYPTNLTMYYGQTFNGVTGSTSADNSPLTGTIILYDDYNGVTSNLCTLNAATANAACPNSVGTTQGTSTGTNIFTSVYSGDSTHASSTSPAVTINVLPDPTTASVSGVANPSPQGQTVVFTATITGTFAAPTGPVTFLYGNNVLGTATLNPGSGVASTATFSTSTLPVGTDPITVSYAATTNFVASSSSVFDEVITANGSGGASTFTLTVTPNPVNIGVGYTTALTVTASSGFNQAINLSCSDLPSEATCVFAEPSIPANGGSVTLLVGTTAPHTCGTNEPYFQDSNGGWPLAPLGIPALAGVLAIFLPGRRRWLRLLVVVIVATGAMQMTGCGNCTDLGTRPNTYTIQVIGTSAGSPSQVQAAPVTINVVI
jgi:hypothetical protein